MISKINPYLKSVSLSLVLTLSACGGGGSSTATTSLSATEIQNAVKSANSADWIMSTVDAIQYAGYTYLNKITTTLSGTNTTTPDLGTLCSQGSYTATWTVGSASAFTVGDTITLTLANCVKADGYTYNGSEKYTVMSMSNNGTSTDEVIFKSSIDNLTVTTPQTTFSDSTLTNLSFSNSDITLNRTRTWSPNTNNYTYPITFKSTGGVSSNMSTSAGNITTGAYSISNATVTYNYASSSSYTSATSLTSSDDTFKNVVLTNTQPKSASTIITIDYPIYLITYSGAHITAKVSNSLTTLSGTNSDGSLISTKIINSSYFN